MQRFVRLGSAVLLMFIVAISQASSLAQLHDLEGNLHTLDERLNNGKWTIVLFWESNCHICNQEAHQYNDFHNKHQASKASILGVSLDSYADKKDALSFIKRHSVTFPNLITTSENAARIYQTATGEPWVGTPTVMVFTPQGKLAAKQVGAVPGDVIEQFITRYEVSQADKS